MTIMKRVWVAGFVAAALLPLAAPAAGQDVRPNGRGNRGANAPVVPPDGKGPAGDQISPMYVQQMFDAMTVVEAEKFLPVPAEQYAAFVVKLKRLQEARATAIRQRNRVVTELRGLVGPQARPDVTDAAIDAKLKELARIEADTAAASRQALDDLDAVLTPRQRARFRLLEENLDRKKLDMLTKVRQPGGPGGA